MLIFCFFLGKFEHVVPCKLSRRQRVLYDEFLASGNTQSTLASGNFLGIINVLMQLRKVRAARYLLLFFSLFVFFFFSSLFCPLSSSSFFFTIPFFQCLYYQRARMQLRTCVRLSIFYICFFFFFPFSFFLVIFSFLFIFTLLPPSLLFSLLLFVLIESGYCDEKHSFSQKYYWYRMMTISFSVLLSHALRQQQQQQKQYFLTRSHVYVIYFIQF